MKVQVLYFDGCPNSLPAVELVAETLRAEGIKTDVERVLVASAEQAQEIEFLGSPTVRINGLDGPFCYRDLGSVAPCGRSAGPVETPKRG